MNKKDKQCLKKVKRTIEKDPTESQTAKCATRKSWCRSGNAECAMKVTIEVKTIVWVVCSPSTTIATLTTRCSSPMMILTCSSTTLNQWMTWVPAVRIRKMMFFRKIKNRESISIGLRICLSENPFDWFLFYYCTILAYHLYNCLFVPFQVLFHFFLLPLFFYIKAYAPQSWSMGCQITFWRLWKISAYHSFRNAKNKNIKRRKKNAKRIKIMTKVIFWWQLRSFFINGDGCWRLPLTKYLN